MDTNTNTPNNIDYHKIPLVLIGQVSLLDSSARWFRLAARRVHDAHGTACCFLGKRDVIHHDLLEATSETATVLEWRQKPLYTTPSCSRWYRIGFPILVLCLFAVLLFVVVMFVLSVFR